MLRSHPQALVALLASLAGACALDDRQVAEATPSNLPGAAGSSGSPGTPEPSSSDMMSAALGGGMSAEQSDQPGPSASTAQGSPTTDTPGVEPGAASGGPCGDGLRAANEACDDGNVLAGDGCSEDCQRLERGFSCPEPGRACMPFAICGDGIVSSAEQCDDGGRVANDGCSIACRIEPGKRCEGQPSVCSDAICGNSLLEGSEGCDDGNAVPFDGCSARCEREPSCVGGVACQSDCGDGFVVPGEQCDDGNVLDGDGCSAACQVEQGSACSRVPSCEIVSGQCTQRVPVLFRDFASTQPDFGNNSCNARAAGAVGTFLNPAGRPTLSAGSQVTEACLSTPENFSQWFSNSAERPTLARELTLFDDGIGGFVNRFGPEGQQFLTSAAYDGDPLFFPVDAVTGGTAQGAPASVPVQYGVPTVTAESTLFPGAPNHNFAFTSEMVVQFVYELDMRGSLTIAADDDVWVFLNGRLALDMGGVHEPITGVVTVDGTLGSVAVNVLDGATPQATFAAADFSMSPGNIYTLSVFHAEREPPVSSFLMGISGMPFAPSECLRICNDGLLGPGEECDDGRNDGGYGECQPGCQLGEHCGDYILQARETCDVGPDGSDSCRGCRVVSAG